MEKPNLVLNLELLKENVIIFFESALYFGGAFTDPRLCLQAERRC